MKRILLVTIIFVSISCHKIKFSKNYVEGKYFGNKSQYSVFVNVENGKAIANWVLIDKFPRNLFTDTLYIGIENNNQWIGRFSKMSYENKQLYIECPNFYFKNELLKTKIKPNERKYIKNSNTSLKIAFVNMERRKHFENIDIFDSLQMTYYFEPALSFEDFVIEYQKFKQLFESVCR